MTLMYSVVKRQPVQTIAGRTVSWTTRNDKCVSQVPCPEHSFSQEFLQEPENNEAPRHKFGKRKKYAVLLSYCGKNYMGMQRNRGVRTIEGELIPAMRKALAFPEIIENDLQKLFYERCSRTDKGVSAARQLISIKMSDLEDPVTQINAHLPSDIRVMCVKRVTKSFNSRHGCVARMYEYLMPTYAFAPYHLSTPEYRIPDATLSLVDELLARYEGVHNFHNFTSGISFSDQLAQRVIISFKSGDPFIVKNAHDMNGKEIEFIPLRVKGQSFVMHQIRKMIGFVIAIVRGLIEEVEFERVFQDEKVDIPRAPGLGLFLDNVFFDRYNAKFCSSGERPKLEWQEVDTEINWFKKDYIHHTIIDTELRKKSMMSWLQRLPFHDFYQTARYLKSETQHYPTAYLSGSVDEPSDHQKLCQIQT